MYCQNELQTKINKVQKTLNHFQKTDDVNDLQASSMRDKTF